MSERNRTIALIGGIGIVLLLICALGYAFLAGRKLDDFAPTMIGFAIPIVTTLLLAAGVSGQMKDIHEKVNGNYSKQAEIIAAQDAQVQKLLAALDPETGRKIIDETGALPVVQQLEQDKEGRHHL